MQKKIDTELHTSPLRRSYKAQERATGSPFKRQSKTRMYEHSPMQMQHHSPDARQLSPLKMVSPIRRFKLVKQAELRASRKQLAKRDQNSPEKMQVSKEFALEAVSSEQLDAMSPTQHFKLRPGLLVNRLDQKAPKFQPAHHRFGGSALITAGALKGDRGLQQMQDY